jgi:hypothetical protein
MKVIRLLIEVFCSYPTRKQLYNIFQPIVIDVKKIDVASHPLPDKPSKRSSRYFW